MTFMLFISLWLAAVGCTIGTEIELRPLQAQARARKWAELGPGGLCPSCGYSRVGLAAGAKCPECGVPAMDRAMRLRRLSAHAWHGRLVVLGVVSAAVAAQTAALTVISAMPFDVSGIMFDSFCFGASAVVSSLHVLLAYPTIEPRRMLVVLAGLLAPQVFTNAILSVIAHETGDALSAGFVLLLGPFLISVPVGVCGQYVGALIAVGTREKRHQSEANEHVESACKCGAGGEDGQDSRAPEGMGGGGGGG